jgi:hypothetical protein
VNEERDIICGQCKASLKGHAYRKYKFPIVTTISVLLLGATTTYNLEQHYIHNARYPVAIEYALINSCATADHRSISRQDLKHKTQACTCALEKTMQKIPYAEYAKDKTFSASFRSYVDECW